MCTGLKAGGGKATSTTAGASGCSGLKSGQDLSTSYANNFKHDLTGAGQAVGAWQNIESLFIHAIYKKFVARISQKMPWLKLAENASLHNDCRSLINHVKINYGSVFRKVALTGLMDSTKQLVKTQYKVDVGHHQHIDRYVATEKFGNIMKSSEILGNIFKKFSDVLLHVSLYF